MVTQAVASSREELELAVGQAIPGLSSPLWVHAQCCQSRYKLGPPMLEDEVEAKECTSSCH